MIPARAYLAAGALALAFGAGWVSNGWRKIGHPVAGAAQRIECAKLAKGCSANVFKRPAWIPHCIGHLTPEVH